MPRIMAEMLPRSGKNHLANPQKGQPGTPDVLQGLNPVNRQSDAVSSETVIQEYQDLVDSYFKAITTRKEKSSDANSK